MKTVSIEESKYLPTICSCCGSKLEWSGTDLKCNNSKCSGLDEADLNVWCDNISPIDGLGYKIRKEFFDKCQLEVVEDLYKRNLTLDGTSATAIKLSKFWDKLHNGIIDPRCALVALNIPRLGWKTADKIVDNNLMILIHDVIVNANTPYMPEKQAVLYCSLEKVVGEATAKEIINNTYKLLRLNLIKDRIGIKDDNNVDSTESKGEVVITGKLNTCKRSEFEKIIIDAGYSLAPAVKKGVIYLITNTPNSGSSKNKKADELGIKKITEEEFLSLIK